MSTRSGLLGSPRRKIRLPITRRKPDQDLVDALGIHAGLILRTAARITGSMADAQDIAQDLAEKLLRKPPEEVRSWPALLKTMAVHAAIDRTRRRRELGDAPEPITHEDPHAALEQLELAEHLRRALGQLSERDAQLFSLCYFADLSHADIGRELGLQANAVGVALHRVRRRLAVLLQATHAPETPEGAPS